MAPFEGLQELLQQHGKFLALPAGTADVMGCRDAATRSAAKEGGDE